MRRDEIVKALRCFASEDNCPFDECNEKCPYWMEIDKYDIDNPNAEISDVHQLCCAAADLLEQDVKHNPADIEEICALRARVENLTLYLQEAFAICPDELAVLDERHPGLPGYAPPTECQSCKIDD